MSVTAVAKYNPFQHLGRLWCGETPDRPYVNALEYRFVADGEPYMLDGQTYTKGEDLPSVLVNDPVTLQWFERPIGPNDRVKMVPGVQYTGWRHAEHDPAV